MVEDKKTKKSILQFMKLCLSTPANKQGKQVFENLSFDLKKKYFISILQYKDFIKFSDNMRLIEDFIKRKYRSTDEIPRDLIELCFDLISIDMILFSKQKIYDEKFLEDEDVLKTFSSIFKNMIKKGKVGSLFL